MVIFGPVSSRVAIHHLFISPGHNFFGRHGLPAGEHATLDVPKVTCCAELGLAGDRFCGYRSNYKGQITFFAWETFAEAKVHFDVPALSASAFRRNVIIEGIDLASLIGATFILGGVEFVGTEESRPCYWMDGVVAPGAENWLRGRGGLRARILTNGELSVGSHELEVVSRQTTLRGFEGHSLVSP